MRLVVLLLVLLCAAEIGSRRSGGGSSRGGSGGRRTSGDGGKHYGVHRASSGGSHYHIPSGGGGGLGVRYHAPKTYVGVGVRPSYSHGSVYGWHYHYAPVYWHGGYAPIVVTPFVHSTYVGCLGCYYVGCATCYYRFHHNGYTYDYYSSKDYLPQKSDVKCSRMTSDLSAEDKAKMAGNSTTTPTEMAWACPSKSVCCGWECCKEPQEDEEESGITTVGWVFIGIGIFIVVCLLIGCIWCCCRNSREAAYYDHHVAAPTTVVHCGGYGSGGVVAYPVEPLY